MNNERHPENYAVFYGLLNRLPSSDKEALKESIVLQYTDNRTCSLREMTLKEYNAACAGMQKLVPPTFQEQLLKVRKKKRSEVLHQMQLLGINTADWNCVNAFARIAVSRVRSSVIWIVRSWIPYRSESVLSVVRRKTEC